MRSYLTTKPTPPALLARTIRDIPLSISDACRMTHSRLHSVRLLPYRLSVIWVKANHEVIVPRSNLDLTTSRVRTFVTFTLTKRTRQVLKGLRADTLRERGRAGRVGEVAKNGRDWVPVRPRAGGRLPDPPRRLRDRHAGHLRNETGTRVGGVALNGIADTVSAAFFAGVRGGVAGDLANISEAPYVSLGAAAGSQLPGAVCLQLIMGERDEATGDSGCTSISRRSPVEHALGIEMIDSVGNTRRWGGAGCGRS